MPVTKQETNNIICLFSQEHNVETELSKLFLSLFLSWINKIVIIVTVLIKI